MVARKVAPIVHDCAVQVLNWRTLRFADANQSSLLGIKARVRAAWFLAFREIVRDRGNLGSIQQLPVERAGGLAARTYCCRRVGSCGRYVQPSNCAAGDTT